MSTRFVNIFLLLGTVIGAGIFSLPVGLKHAGVIVFVFFMVGMAFIMARINFFYRAVIDSVAEPHQLPGYVHKIIGKTASYGAVALLLFSTLGALLAYLIMGGEFLSQIVPVAPEKGSMIFFAVGFTILFFGGRALESLDVLFSGIKIVLFIIVIVVTWVLYGSSPQSIPLFGGEPHLAYGVILFSLTGFSIVPELRKSTKVTFSLNIAQSTAAVLYLLFAFTFLPYLEGPVVTLSQYWHKLFFNLAGIFSVFTPYLMLSWVGYDLFNKDLKVGKKISLFFITVIPFLFFIGGVHSFVQVISFTGAVFLGALGIVISRLYQKRFPQKHTLLNYAIQAVFLIGIIAEVWQFVR